MADMTKQEAIRLIEATVFTPGYLRLLTALVEASALPDEQPEPQHKPCPCCGDSPILVPYGRGAYVSCPSCSLQTSVHGPEACEAWAAWDRRTGA